MKATGIVRRIDDLGRVVIPKEIRRTMRIREGDPLEIFTEKDGEVIFKKYSPIGELGDFAANYVSGLPKKDLVEKRVSRELDDIMNDKVTITYESGRIVSVADGNDKYNAGVVVPIISEGDTIGSVVFVMKDGEKPSVVDDKLAASSNICRRRISVFLRGWTDVVHPFFTAKHGYECIII